MNLVDPGDTVISCHWGFFGSRLNDFAHRVGANVVELTADLGQIADVDRVMEDARGQPRREDRERRARRDLDRRGVPGRGARRGDARERLDALLYVDCVTSLGGQQVEAEAWGIDYGYSCSQKALGCPPGIAPVTISRARSRRWSPPGARCPTTTTSRSSRSTGSTGRSPTTTRCRSCSTTRCTRASGSPSRRASRRGGRGNEDAGRYFQDEIRARGLRAARRPGPPARGAHRGAGARGRRRQGDPDAILREHSIEVGGGLGPTAPPIWRVGLMGVNANRETADRVLAAFDAVLPASRGTS